MKKILFLLLFVCANIYSQKLSLNESTNFYEFSKIVETNDEKTKGKFIKRFKQINLENIESSEKSIKGNGFTNHLVGGYATVEINYTVKVDFKKGRYRMTITNFKLTDKNGSNPLEGMRSYKKKWLKKINKKLPEIISNIENLNTKEEEW